MIICKWSRDPTWSTYVRHWLLMQPFIVCIVLSKRFFQKQYTKSTKQDLQRRTWPLVMLFSLHFSLRRSSTIFLYSLISSIWGMKILTMCLNANLTMIYKKASQHLFKGQRTFKRTRREKKEPKIEPELMHFVLSMLSFI